MTTVIMTKPHWTKLDIFCLLLSTSTILAVRQPKWTPTDELNINGDEDDGQLPSINYRLILDGTGNEDRRQQKETSSLWLENKTESYEINQAPGDIIDYTPVRPTYYNLSSTESEKQLRKLIATQDKGDELETFSGTTTESTGDFLTTSWPSDISNIFPADYPTTNSNNILLSTSTRITTTTATPTTVIHTSPEFTTVTFKQNSLSAEVPNYSETTPPEENQGSSMQKIANKVLRWCFFGGAEVEALCWRMAQALKRENILNNVVCIRARNAYECVQHVHNNVADATRLNAEQIYVAGKRYGLLPIVHERWPEFGEFTDDTVVIVRKDPSKPKDPYEKGIPALQGKKLCLSGSDNKNLQYQSLINVLFPLGVMKVHNRECSQPLASMVNFFGSSCVPGKWSLDPEQYKQYSSLCRGCYTTCASDDYFAGPEGAIRCLVEGLGDVAVTNSVALAHAELDPDQFQLLCIQGTRKAINSNVTCVWMGRRTPAVVVSPKVPKVVRDQWRDALMYVFRKFQGVQENWTKYWHKNITAANDRALANKASAGSNNSNGTRAGDQKKDKAPPPRWLSRVIFSRGNLSSVDDVYYRSTPERYVGEIFVRSMDSPFPVTECGHPLPLRWCFFLEHRYEKCLQLSMALSAQRLRPQLQCVKARAAEECQRMVASGAADITTIRADQMIAATVDDKLLPVAIEQYADNQATKYALAVIRKGSNVTLQTLPGTRSCHPGADYVLGWNAPLTVLEGLGLTKIIDCDYARAASTLFWESCVPEIAKYATHQQTLQRKLNDVAMHESMCRMCGGLDYCDHSSPYRGYDGVLKCLENKNNNHQQGGDIGFVTSDILYNRQPNVVNDLNKRFELLCTDGKKKALTDYKECNWLRVPGHLLVVSGNTFGKEADRRTITDFIMEIQELYGRAPDVTKLPSIGEPDYAGRLNIFSSESDQNGLFGNATQQLWPIYPDQSLNDVLGKQFATVYHKLKQCTNRSSSQLTAQLLMPLHILVLVTLLNVLCKTIGS